jgi:hypothetical protein
MPFYNASYNDETLALLKRALDDAWRYVERAMAVRSPSGESAARRLMALRIMAAADLGERDPERLTRAALQSVEPRFAADTQKEKVSGGATGRALAGVNRQRPRRPSPPSLVGQKSSLAAWRGE